MQCVHNFNQRREKRKTQKRGEGRNSQEIQEEAIM